MPTPEPEQTTPAEEARRAFLATAGKATAAAPAAALLLAASAIPDKAHAQLTSGSLPAGGGLGALLVFGGAAAAWHALRQQKGEPADQQDPEGRPRDQG